MKIKKVLSLVLFVLSLNLATNFTNCFSMDNDSVTEVEISGRTNGPICRAERDSKTRTILCDRFKSKQYTTACPGKAVDVKF